ncbi:MAG: DUF1573 domain-containing protein [Pseudomonadota bacterium]
MRIGRLTTLVVVLNLCVSASAYAGPKVGFDAESYDYGRVLSGDTVTKEFTLTNTGDETLTIEKLTSSCGCTKAVKGSREVPPKGTTKIVVAFDTAGLRPGRKSQSVGVHTNDTSNPVVKLTVFADVVREITVEPPSLAKQLPAFTDTVTFPMKITNSSAKSCTIKGIKVPKDGIGAALEPKSVTVKPNATATFDLVLKLKKEPGRHYYMGKLILVLDHPKEPGVEIRYLIKFAKTE